ncbi:MAG: hypothetical protein ABIO65_10270 [Nitrospiria bacterium]
MAVQLKEKLQAHALEAALATLGTAIPAWLLIAESHLVPYVSRIDPTTVLRVLAVLVALSAWSTALLLFFRPRLKFDTQLGIYRDRKSGIYYCSSCYSAKRRAPLKEFKSGWRCVVKDCNMWFENPTYKEPPSPRPQAETRPKSWVRDW